MDLTEAQRAAVETTERRTLIVAGPGSGKTRVCVERAKWLLRRRFVTEARAITFVTFTTKAADEIRERFVEETGRHPRAGTFHSLAYQILLRYGDAIGLRLPFTVLGEGDQTDIFQQVLRGYGWKPKGKAAEKWARWHNDYLRDRSKPKAFTRMQPDDFRVVVAEYRRRIREMGIVDYPGLLTGLWELLEIPEVAFRIRRETEALFQDEGQDVDGFQHILAERLVRPDAWFSIVGDISQAIYSWRDAQPEILLGESVPVDALEALTGEPATFTLPMETFERHEIRTNWRCGRAIAAGADRLLGRETGVPDGTPDGEVVLLSVSSDSEPGHIAKVAEDRLDRGTFAIIARTNRKAAWATKVLRVAGLQVHLAGEQGALWNRPAAREFAAIARTISNPFDSWSAERALRSLCGASDADVVRARARDTADTLRGFVIEFAGDEAAEAILGIRPKRREDDEDILAGSDTWRLHRLGEIVAQYAPEGLRGPDLNEALAAAWEFADGGGSLADFVFHSTFGGESHDVEPGAVWVSTGHKAKGREFDSVLILDATSGKWPAPWAGADEAEERRLFYVSATRARRWLGFVSREGKDPSEYVGEGWPDLDPKVIPSPQQELFPRDSG